MQWYFICLVCPTNGALKSGTVIEGTSLDKAIKNSWLDELTHPIKPLWMKITQYIDEIPVFMRNKCLTPTETLIMRRRIINLPKSK